MDRGTDSWDESDKAGEGGSVTALTSGYAWAQLVSLFSLVELT